jgi:hypothetical protein
MLAGLRGIADNTRQTRARHTPLDAKLDWDHLKILNASSFDEIAVVTCALCHV